MTASSDPSGAGTGLDAEPGKESSAAPSFAVNGLSFPTSPLSPIVNVSASGTSKSGHLYDHKEGTFALDNHSLVPAGALPSTSSAPPPNTLRSPYQQTAHWHPSQNPILHPRLLCSVLPSLCLKSPYWENGYNNRTPFMGLLQGNELTHAQVLERSLPSSPYTVPVHPSSPFPPCSLPSPLSLFLPLPFSPSLFLPFVPLFSFFLPPFRLSFFILNY